MPKRKGKVLFKINEFDGKLKTEVEAAFEAQGVSIIEGTHRVLRTFVEFPELRPLLLDQVKGLSRKDLARAILRRMGK